MDHCYLSPALNTVLDCYGNPWTLAASHSGSRIGRCAEIVYSKIDI